MQNTRSAGNDATLVTQAVDQIGGSARVIHLPRDLGGVPHTNRWPVLSPVHAHVSAALTAEPAVASAAWPWLGRR